jgi:hypothetical protein
MTTIPTPLRINFFAFVSHFGECRASLLWPSRFRGHQVDWIGVSKRSVDEVPSGRIPMFVPSVATEAALIGGHPYWKLYRPADDILPAVPMLILSDGNRSDVIIGLRGLGWGTVSDLTNAPGRVAITQEELCVEVNGVTMIHERAPSQPAPTGWYEAVAALAGRCLVVVAPVAMFGEERQLIVALRAAASRNIVAAAIVPVTLSEL